ncbi:MAG: hypothetical protein ACI87E_004614 [Mariniblastus sp.]|jgi:hypothetical protein
MYARVGYFPSEKYWIELSGIPTGMRIVLGGLSGSVAALNCRLPSVIPSGSTAALHVSEIKTIISQPQNEKLPSTHRSHWHSELTNSAVPSRSHESSWACCFNC